MDRKSCDLSGLWRVKHPSIDWIEILRLTATNGVRVRIVTRPPGKQGGILDEGVEELINSIRALGVTVDLRAYMHEKFAILDNKILWHGSLNILSHNKTSESVLRIPSPAACQQMARFISSSTGWKAGEKEEIYLTIKENPECPDCGSPTIWKNGRFGVYFECEAGCGGKTDLKHPGAKRKRKKSSGQTSGQTKTDHVCPECVSPMIERKADIELS